MLPIPVIGRTEMVACDTGTEVLRLAISGASGFLGGQLIPYLRARGVVLLLVGRNPSELAAKYPDCRSVSYDEIETAATDYDALLHLATINSDANETIENFQRVNVDLAVQTSVRAEQARVKKFIYVSSTHALDPARSTAYAKTKRAAVRALSENRLIDVRILYLPAVVGNEFVGKLSVLNAMPQSLRKLALSILASLRPTVDAAKVADTILAMAVANGSSQKAAILTNGQSRNLVFRVVKRILDMGFAVSVLALLGWFMIIVGIAIRLQSPGPALFRQARVGRYQRSFTCFKFRTMYLSTPNVGTHEVPAALVTKLGGFLRRTKLDELPQVFNIIMNQMSLVGPRPSLPSQFDVVAARHARGVFVAKPGITGLAQVRGIDMSNPDDLATADEIYLKLQSILLDLKIIVQTAFGKGGGDNVRRP